jgi:hypothetical protein
VSAPIATRITGYSTDKKDSKAILDACQHTCCPY